MQENSMIRTLKDEQFIPQVELNSSDVISKNDKEIERYIDLINSLDRTKIMIALGGIKQMDSIISKHWIKLGLADALINVLLNYQSFDLLIIDSILKYLLQLTICSIDDSSIFCREDFIICLLHIDIDIHFSSGVHCLTLLNNLLIDHKTNQQIIEILEKNDFPSY